MGPLISDEAVNKIKTLIDDAVSKGAQITTGGTATGRFFESTVLKFAQQNRALAQEEIFGPLAPVFSFSDEQQVITLANDIPLGLASYFYSRDINRITRVSEALEYGIVGINTGLISNEAAPFGGIKQSGLGREGSKYGLDDYLEIKYLLLDIMEEAS